MLSAEDADPAGSLKNHVSDELDTYIKVVGLVDIKLEVPNYKITIFILD